MAEGAFRFVDHPSPRSRGFFLGARDDQLTASQVEYMRRDLQRTFESYGMEASNFEASMNVHGGRDWRLVVSLNNESPPMEMRMAGSRHVRYIEGRRGATVVIEGDSTDLHRAGSEAILFRQIAEALHRLVRQRMISGETINVSCHELLHRYLEDGGRFDRFDEVFPPLRRAREDDRWQRELLDNWHFSPKDVESLTKQLEKDSNGPTEDELEASYRV